MRSFPYVPKAAYTQPLFPVLGQEVQVTHFSCDLRVAFAHLPEFCFPHISDPEHVLDSACDFSHLNLWQPLGISPGILIPNYGFTGFLGLVFNEPMTPCFHHFYLINKCFFFIKVTPFHYIHKTQIHV